jgi:hypothetical protein
MNILQSVPVCKQNKIKDINEKIPPRGEGEGISVKPGIKAANVL